MSSDAGYGFMVQLKELFTKNKAGKALLNLPEGAQIMRPSLIFDPKSDRLVAISNEGRMLCVSGIRVARSVQGKGNKIISIPPSAWLQRRST